FDADNYSVKHVLSVSRLAGNPVDGFEVAETVFPASDDNVYLALYEAPSFGGWIDELGCYVMLFATEEPMADGGKNHSTICWVYADDLMSDIWHYGENNVDDIVEYTGDEYLSGNKGNVLFDTSGRYHKNMQSGEMEFVNQITYMHGNNHGGMARINGKWYDFGHRPAGNGGAHRQGVAGIVNLYLAEDGTPVIEPVEYTSCGVSEYLDAAETWNANTTCYLIPGLGKEAAEGGEGQETVEGFDQPYIEVTRDPQATHASYVTAIKSGNIVGFKHIGFGDEEKDVTFHMLVSKDAEDIDGVVHVYLDSPDETKGGVLIGSVDLSKDAVEAGESTEASDGTIWHWVSGAMDVPVSGIHPVYLIFEAEGDGYICSFDQFSFSE
ncbi:MAG: hypothetical protein Q4D71_14670, partial [Oscillospiraceae bacterium]|nr:hypothetical protein [Oscillospiraceae bacterium]